MHVRSSWLFEHDKLKSDFASNFLASAQIYDRSVVKTHDVQTIKKNAKMHNNIRYRMNSVSFQIWWIGQHKYCYCVKGKKWTVIDICTDEKDKKDESMLLFTTILSFFSEPFEKRNAIIHYDSLIVLTVKFTALLCLDWLRNRETVRAQDVHNLPWILFYDL